ncbi:GNAT family N-acetyltransferase [Polaribacter sp. P097]|uniref:GNAT family N-acetyltransferase n=1 Tax=Polaribacter sp. P097 TaxID=3117398 RepID=UPI002FE3A0A2
MIVKATALDAQLLTSIAIESKSFWGYSSELLRSWKADLTVTKTMIENLHCFKVLNHEETVGFYILNKPKNKNVELEFLFVKPNFIGKGFGNQLLQHAIFKSITLNVKTITLLADPNAEAFYKSKGFVVINQKESSVNNRFLPVMKLDLTDHF